MTDCRLPADYKIGDRVRVVVDPGGPSMTKQAMSNECDARYIVNRFRATGQMPPVRWEGSFGDFYDVPDFHRAMQIVRRGEEAFGRLPARVRGHFRNDPGEYVRACSDPARADELRALGLAEPLQAPTAPLKVEVVNPTEGSSSGDEG